MFKRHKKMIWNFCVLFVVLVAQSEAQFHQDSYHIVHDRIEIVDYNRTAVIDPTVKLFKYNDTVRMKAINGSAYFTPGVYKNVLINAAVFKFAAKAYRPFPINMTIDGCEETKSNLFGIQSAMEHSNFRGCPCPVGLYYIYNYVLEEDRFPPHLPFGNYKLEVKVRIDDNIYLLSINWYGSIVRRSKDD